MSFLLPLDVDRRQAEMEPHGLQWLENGEFGIS